LEIRLILTNVFILLYSKLINNPINLSTAKSRDVFSEGVEGNGSLIAL
jgi:hypothetical protein